MRTEDETLRILYEERISQALYELFAERGAKGRAWKILDAAVQELFQLRARTIRESEISRQLAPWKTLGR